MTRRFELLRREFGDEFGPDYVERVGRRHYARLIDGARVIDYIPLLVYRSTKDELRGGTAQLAEAA